MNIKRIAKYAKVLLLSGSYSFTIQPDVPSIKVRNAAQAINEVISFLQKQQTLKIPDLNTKWQEKTIYSTERQDYAITSKLFTSNDWNISIFQGVAPLSRTVYEISVFNSNLRFYWKGSVRADGSITEETAFKVLAEDESQKLSEELAKKNQVPPPKPGGYGH